MINKHSYVEDLELKIDQHKKNIAHNKKTIQTYKKYNDDNLERLEIAEKDLKLFNEFLEGKK